MSVFTEIIAGNIPGRFVWADETCVAFGTHEPIKDGHTLVVPRQEVSRFTDLDEEAFAHLAVVAQKIGRAQEHAFSVPRAMLMIAGMEVPHVHLHVIPATSEADIRFENAQSGLPGEKMDAAIEKVRDALRELGYGEFVPADLHSL
ncbi:HIT family protein [Ancrocorticia populi]|uniref:Diadenosine tetraphosphate hydrolase n=1 Tax=Ancrocorticia populi TaxID=2175228 RepID=A0A2V1K773_9ACTO|nr:HIT family protein [Ancrocorticia populi]PWF26468.1 diadenosine tetraphosphate hydrolase [Ancrocorticia populi]